MDVNKEFWQGRRVFLTGHTGFKGAWLALWLRKLGAEVCGLALPPATQPSLFSASGLADNIRSQIGDVRDAASLVSALQDSGASVVFHLAAVATVAEGYRAARETFDTNVMGTVNLLDALAACPEVRAVVVVTSDKCYRPTPGANPFKEVDALGGNEPYSASKACAELVAHAWRQAFLNRPDAPRLATARAGNVIGGGDWAKHRLLPDLLRDFGSGQTATLRMPQAIRPWQHVLEALSGYLCLAQRLVAEDGDAYARAWNFGPAALDHLSVGEIARLAACAWGEGAQIRSSGNFQEETECLMLDAGETHLKLGWLPRWNAARAVRETLAWHKAWLSAPHATASTAALCAQQIDAYQASPPRQLRR